MTKKWILGALICSLAWFGGGNQAEAAIYREAEPNDAFETATPLVLNEICEGAVSHPDDLDYYTFSLTEPMGVTIDVPTPDQHVQRDAVKVYRETKEGRKELLVEGSGIGFTGFSTMNLGVGKYYISVDCYAGEITEYGIKVNTHPCYDRDEREWNDTWEQADKRESVNDEVWGDILLQREGGDEDWFSLEIHGRYYFQPTLYKRNFDQEIVTATLYDSSLKELSSVRQEGREEVRGTEVLAEAGTYYLKVTAEVKDMDFLNEVSNYWVSFGTVSAPVGDGGTGNQPSPGDDGNTPAPGDDGSQTTPGDNGNTPAPGDTDNQIRLDRTKLQVAVGGSSRLSLKGAEGRITWKSGNPSVAKVSADGKVTGKKAGKTTITAVFGGKSYSCQVMVVPKKQRITYLKSKKAGQATVKWRKDSGAKGYQIRYSTDKGFRKGVKTVTIGKNSTYQKTLTGLSRGKTYYVQVRSYSVSGGKKLYGSYSASSKVKVKGTSSSKGKLNKTKARLSVGARTQLKLTGVSGSVSWKSSRPSVATVSKGKVQAKGIGSARITAVCGGKTYTCQVTVVPKKQKLTYAKSQKPGQAVLKWKKLPPAKGYQIAYSKDRSFRKGVRTVTVSKGNVYKKTISGLEKGKTYYFKIRAYGTQGGKRLYGAYSSTVKVRS